MKFTRFRTLVAAGAIGVVGIAGVAATGVAGAQTTDTSGASARGAFIRSLTDEQRACLQSNGVVKPDHRLTKDERIAAAATLTSAAATCNITLPERPAGALANARRLRADLKALTPEQRTCLETNGVTKPDHKLTRAERRAWHTQLESAATACGITLG